MYGVVVEKLAQLYLKLNLGMSLPGLAFWGVFFQVHVVKGMLRRSHLPKGVGMSDVLFVCLTSRAASKK